MERASSHDLVMQPVKRLYAYEANIIHDETVRVARSYSSSVIQLLTSPLSSSEVLYAN